MTRITDTFLRPDGNIIGITPDAWSWTKIAGNDSGFMTYQNQLTRTPDQTTASVVSNKTFATNDQFFEFSTIGGFPVGTATLNVSGRLNYNQAGGIGYVVTYTPKIGTTPGKMAVSKLGGTAQTGTSVDVSFESTTYFKWKATSVRSGVSQVISVFIDDAQVLQWTDATGAPNAGYNFSISSYANSARKDANNKAFYAGTLKAGDVVASTRYSLSQFADDTESPIKLEAIQDGATPYPGSYIDYVVGEPDATYPPAYNAGYYNS